MAGDRQSCRDKGAQVWRIRDAAKVADLPIDYGTRGCLQPRWEVADDDQRTLPALGGRHLAGSAADRRSKARCFSPDGRLLVVQDASKVIRLVEAETGRTLARLESPDLCEVWRPASAPTARAWW